MHLGKPKFRTAFWILQAGILVSYLSTVVWASGLYDSTGFGVAFLVLLLTIFTIGIWIVLDAMILAIHAFVTSRPAVAARNAPKQSPHTRPDS
jgi:uncharacterized membrane protein